MIKIPNLLFQAHIQEFWAAIENLIFMIIAHIIFIFNLCIVFL